MPELELSPVQHSLAKILQSAGFSVMVYEADEASLLVIDALRRVDDDKIRIIVDDSGAGALVSDDGNIALQSWELVLIALLSVGPDGDRLALPWKDPLPRLKDGRLDYGRIEFNEQNIERVLDEVLKR